MVVVLVYIDDRIGDHHCSPNLYRSHYAFVGGLMSYLGYLGLFTYSGIQHILCCVFCLVCLRLVYPMLPVSLYCPFLIAPSIFYNIYYILFYEMSVPGKGKC